MTPLSLSQSALDAYGRCPRRFYLRFVRRLEWPAPLTGSEQEWERALQRGERLHLLIQQEALGLSAEDHVADTDDPELARWWRAYRQQPPPQPEGRVHSELELSVPFSGHHLVARFDRVVVVDGEPPALHIVDWKTGRAQDPERLARSWQTVIYRYVAVEGGAALTASRQRVAPEDVTFVYWQAEDPGSATVLRYDEQMHADARRRLADGVAAIETSLEQGEEGFARTPDGEACRRCPFRAYCERGREAPAGLDVDPDWEAEAESGWGGLPDDADTP